MNTETEQEEIIEDEMSEDQLQEIEDAFDSGYGDGELEVDPDPIEDEFEEELETEEPEEPEEEPEQELDAQLGPDIDDIPASVKERLDRIENIAKSASGRAQKAQDAITNIPAAVVGAAGPPKELLQRALTDDEAFEALRRDWPDQADVLGNIVDAVGDQMESQREEIVQSVSAQVNSSAANLRLIAALDSAHPDWEETKDDPAFHDWVYEGGPNKEERQVYDQLAGKQDPQATEYYGALLDKYPEWGEDKGKLYVTNTARASISLLDKYADKDMSDAQQEIDKVNAESRRTQRQRRLSRNIPATTGRSSLGSKTVDRQKEVEDAFDEGYNS